MLQNFRSKPRNIKLDMQAGMPSIKSLEEMKHHAMANAGATVELPFRVDNLTQTLTATREQGTFMWMLYVDEGFGSHMDWSHMSPDASCIHTLLSNSHPEFYTKHHSAAPMATAAFGAPQPPQPQQQNVIKSVIEGNLKEIQIANLLQSINLGQMTGRLEIISSSDQATIRFSNGDAIHASMRGATGNEAILQLFIWTEGSFAFYNEPKSVSPNVKGGLTSLIMEGATFSDHYAFLKTKGLSNQCFPIRVMELASAEELSVKVKEGVDCSKDLQWSLYQKVTGTRSWAEIIRDLPAKKTEWVPPLFNLVHCGVIKLGEAPTPVAALARRKVDWSVAQTVRTSMSRADTGLFTYAALLYSLEQDFCRHEAFDLPFSLIVFGYCMKLPAGAGEKSGLPQFIPIKASAVVEMGNRIGSVRKKYDLLAHYGAFGYALFLPLTLKQNALQLAEIVAETCAGIRVTDEFDNALIEFRAGVANIPEDCQTLDELLTLAEDARARGNSPLR